MFRYQASTGDIKDDMEDPSESSHDPYQVNIFEIFQLSGYFSIFFLENFVKLIPCYNFTQIFFWKNFVKLI